MIWRIFTVVGLILINLVTTLVFNSYQRRSESYTPDIFWLSMVIVGIMFIYLVYYFNNINQTNLFIFTGFHIGFIVSIRMIIGKESEREVTGDMTTDEKIDWRESQYDYKPSEGDSD